MQVSPGAEVLCQMAHQVDGRLARHDFPGPEPAQHVGAPACEEPPVGRHVLVAFELGAQLVADSRVGDDEAVGRAAGEHQPFELLDDAPDPDPVHAPAQQRDEGPQLSP